ncbi:MAG: sulfite exporter TauE/SafE family protein [Oscillospiraceae bacterium]
MCGFGIGLLNGLLGAGGGMLAVPMLKKLGLETKQAHATAIAVIVPLSIISCGTYLYKGYFKLSMAYIFIPLGLVGAFIGTVILRKVSDKWIRLLFSLLIIYSGIRFILA